MSKYQGHLATLSWDRTGGTTLVTVGQIRDIGGPSISREAIDVYTRDSTEHWREFLRGTKDPGDLTFDVILDPALATHGTATGLASDLDQNAATIPAWRLTLPNTDYYAFSGFLTAFELTNNIDEPSAADITVKITGKPTLTI